MNRTDTVGASRETAVMLDFLFFHPDAPRVYRLCQIVMNRGENRSENREYVTGALTSTVTLPCTIRTRQEPPWKNKIIIIMIIYYHCYC